MALWGQNKDIQFVKLINEELIHKIISQQCGYYSIVLDETKSNMYGEGVNKNYIGPVLIPCIIVRGDSESKVDERGPNKYKTMEFRFYKDDLINANVVPQIGDIVLWNEDYFEVDNNNENQLIAGKDPDYAYTQSDNKLNQFGDSLSIILSAHYTDPDKLGLTQTRA